jgi:hypothetical protein
VDVVKFAYADPPYIGCAGYYAEREEVDHAQLITRLVDEFPDGWALSCHTPSLRLLLPMTPEDTRVMAWVKPWAVFKPNVNPAYAWEPVLVRGGRKRARNEETERDWVSAGITLKRGMVGVKPDAFAFWLFRVFGMRREDELVDLYPGTGAVTRAWLQWRDRLL